MKKRNINVLMIGSDPTTVKGGIISVINNYLNYKNWDNIKLSFISTHKDGNVFTKILFFILNLIRIDIFLLKNKPNIVHIHVSERGSFTRKSIIISHIRKLSKNSKVILHHHGAEFNQYYEKLSNKQQRKIRKTLKTVDLNIVLSKKLICTIKDKEPTAKVEVLYNAVSTYNKNKYNKSAREILFLGRLGERKGTYDLIDVLTNIHSQLVENKITVNLCGDGEIEKVKNTIQSHNIQDIISHVGWITAKEKEEIFSKTIINILPSYNEGLPMTILETMAYGIPNISTNIASIPEVIKNNETGLLIQPGDKKQLEKEILKLITDSKLRNKISENSKQLIDQNFSIEEHINHLKKIYTKIIQ